MATELEFPGGEIVTGRRIATEPGVGGFTVDLEVAVNDQQTTVYAALQVEDGEGNKTPATLGAEHVVSRTGDGPLTLEVKGLSPLAEQYTPTVSLNVEANLATAQQVALGTWRTLDALEELQRHDLIPSFVAAVLAATPAGERAALRQRMIDEALGVLAVWANERIAEITAKADTTNEDWRRRLLLGA